MNGWGRLRDHLVVFQEKIRAVSAFNKSLPPRGKIQGVVSPGSPGSSPNIPHLPSDTSSSHLPSTARKSRCTLPFLCPLSLSASTFSHPPNLFPANAYFLTILRHCHLWETFVSRVRGPCAVLSLHTFLT